MISLINLFSKILVLGLLIYSFNSFSTPENSLLASPISKTPPAIQLATQYRKDIQVQRYFVSEKLDGIRAYWDGKNLISKQGNKFTAPTWFTQSFPKTPLDGELWIKRQSFELVSSIIRTQDKQNKKWQQVKFMIFDLPHNPLPFAERVVQMQHITNQANSNYLKMIEQTRVDNNSALFMLLDETILNKGEGLMLHHEDAVYQSKRNNQLMKLKRFTDAEATVIAQLPGKAKYRGLLGALVVKNTEGVTFKIGTGFSDQERHNPPAIGSTITYRFTGKTKNNVPRFASFLRIRVVY